MSDFSTISFHSDFPLIPPFARQTCYQSKDLPEHETMTACIGGDVHANGLFERDDGLWNPSLNGWIRLIAQFGHNEFSLRFQDGRAVEVITGRDPPEGAIYAYESPNDWRDIKVHDSL